MSTIWTVLQHFGTKSLKTNPGPSPNPNPNPSQNPNPNKFVCFISNKCTIHVKKHKYAFIL